MDKKILIAVAAALVAAVLLLMFLLAPTPETGAAPLTRDDATDSKDTEYNYAFSDYGSMAGGGAGSSGSGPSNLDAVAASSSVGPVATGSSGPVTVSEQIEEAVITYSPEAVDVIAPHLSSSNPDTREEAIEGLIQLGEPAGAKLLRKKASSVTDPRLRARLIQAAEFIELPPAVFFSSEN